MRCPNCGYEPEYEYRGWMQRYLPTILKMLRIGHSPSDVVRTLYSLHGDKLAYDPTPAMIEYIRRRYGIEPPDEAPASHRKRNREIAARYHAGDITPAQLGHEFGLSADRVRIIIARVERDAEREEEAQLAYQAAERIEDVPLDVLDLPVRVLNCLKYSGPCQTVGDAMRLGDAELLRTGNFGRRSLQAWKSCLEALKRDFDKRKQPEAQP